MAVLPVSSDQKATRPDSNMPVPEASPLTATLATTQAAPAPPSGAPHPTVPPATPGPTPTPSGAQNLAQSNQQGYFMDWQGALAQHQASGVSRAVRDDELVREQLLGLTRGDSRYIQQARDLARAAASERGLLGSSYAMGAAERAAIDAALPIAAQDAAWYGQTARDNQMTAQEAMLQNVRAAQAMVGQEYDARFRADQASRDREFTAGENAANRAHAAALMSAELQWRSTEAARDRDHQAYLQGNDQAWRGVQADLDREFQAFQANLDRTWRGDMAERDRQEARFRDYQQQLFGREGQLAAVLQGIYSNPNLTPQQQAAAAENARATMTGLWESFNRTFAAGIPPIFANPYPQLPGAGAAPAAAPALPAPAAPALGASAGYGGGVLGGAVYAARQMVPP